MSSSSSRVGTDLLYHIFENAAEDRDYDPAAYGRCLIVLGWISKPLYEASRKTDLFWRSWKRHCETLRPRIVITSESRHINSEHLALTNRSRCYTANEHGYFLPHGGNGGPRCENYGHYYRSSLAVKWPVAKTCKSNFVKWTLQAYEKMTRFNFKTDMALEEAAAAHQQLCDELAQSPWLNERLQKICQKKLTKSEQQVRDGFVQFRERKRRRLYDNASGGSSDDSGSSGSTSSSGDDDADDDAGVRDQ